MMRPNFYPDVMDLWTQVPSCTAKLKTKKGHTVKTHQKCLGDDTEQKN